MNDARLTTLQQSRDPLPLLRIGLELARSQKAEDHQLLQSWLGRAEFLGRLDTEEEYESAGRGRLRIGAVLADLSRNPAATARAVLVQLTQVAAFTDEGSRVDLLIRHTVVVNPPPPALVQFWDAYSKPDDGFTPLTIDTLTQNGSVPALQLLERKFTDPGHSAATKREWMHRSVLPHRNNLELLLMCHRLLAAGLPDELRVDLVESLFDYKPDDWYPEHLIRTPPARRLASAEAKAQLRRIAELALRQLKLPAALKFTVEAALQELEAR